MDLTRDEETLLAPVIVLWLVTGLGWAVSYLFPNSELTQAYAYVGVGLVLVAVCLTLLLVQRARIRRKTREVLQEEKESRERLWPDSK